MPNKPQGKSWREVKIAIAAIGVTATLGFWNMFSIPDKNQVNAQVLPSDTPPPPPPPTETAEPTATASFLALRPVKIIYGGTAPQQQVIQVAAAPAPAKQHKGGGGGGPSNPPSNPAPAPHPITGPSK